MTWLWSLKNTTIFVHGPYFDPMTPPLGVLKSQSRTSTHLGSFPGRVPTVLPRFRVPSRVPAVLALLFGVSYMQYIQLGSLGRLYM